MRNRVIRAAVAAAGSLMCAAGFASAAQATDVDYINTSSAWIDGSAGSFNGTVNFFDGTQEKSEGAAIGRILLTGTDQTGAAVSIPVYCVDVSDWLGNGHFVTQTLDSLSNNATLLNNLTKFITYGDALVNAASGYQKTEYSAATQLGVWELLNESASSTWNLTTGNFYITQYDNTDIFAAATVADSWLDLLAAGHMPASATETLKVLNPGAGNQTQVFITSRSNSENSTPGVPEPATWGMIVVGFGLLGSALRRRKQDDQLLA
jgi:hypothetical protein